MADIVRAATEGPIRILTIDRPKALNALNAQTWEELMAAFDAAAADPAIRAVILEGAGGNFVAGADIKEFEALDEEKAEARSRRIAGYYDRIRRLPKPTIAAIDGWCLGGGFELAVACDLRIASNRAKLGMPEVKIGIFPGTAATVLFQALMGPMVARELCLLGEPIDASRAHALGIVSEVVAPEALAAAARAMATKLAALPPVALRECKRVLDGMLDGAMAGPRELEYSAYRRVFGTDDKKEGVAAFIAKRKPNYRGR
ncbi:MAG: hypothetical protein FJX47_19305 [Alphaproteobacteria bacterium]|nr:hypothetical protein [Alphaproteobacteria bacterium]